MDYNKLLDLVSDLGYELAMSGAETFRVEESMSRVLASYGVQSEVFAVPNYLIVSITTESGKPITRMRRIGFHGNDIDAIEWLNGLSRALCNHTPDPEEGTKWLKEVRTWVRHYPFPVYLLGNFMGAAGFGVLFGCSWIDSICSGICGILIGIIGRITGNLKTNPYFSTILSSFLMGLLAYTMSNLGITDNADGIVIGALMLLVPGLMFVNSMRDIIYGDTNSGINRFIQVALIAVSIAVGIGAALQFITFLWKEPIRGSAAFSSLPVECIATAVGCVGFSILFNIHGYGDIICTLGGVIAWAIYSLTLRYTGDQISGYFWASLFCSFYSEIMARIRKYPAISYLVVSLFPLIPGAGVYYTMNYAILGDMSHFTSQARTTAGIAGVMAVGILTATSLVRIYYTWIQSRSTKK